MGHFLMGLSQAAYYTFQALLKGPSKTLQEMYSAQEDRYHAFAEMMTELSYKPHQVLARKQYWCGQTFFLAQLIKSNTDRIQEIIKKPISIENEDALLDAINSLVVALDDHDALKQFLIILEDDSKKSEMAEIKPKEHKVPSSHPEIQLVCGDAIQLVKDLLAQGTAVVINNAPNSHRDGAAKYSAGSVEELFSRYTDEALKMVLHFDDVHRRNVETGHYAFMEKPELVDVSDYQRRYLKMVLTICAKLIEKKETYLETKEFFNDLFTSFPNTEEHSKDRLPIYFGMQNNVFEVPVDGGFTSSQWFVDTKNLNTVEGIFRTLDLPDVLNPITLVGYAAPDLRKIETSPLDARSTSNKTLQHPDIEGTLGNALTFGIASQCQQAIRLAQQFNSQGINQPVAVVFIMPGCGAFNNPEKATAAHFISTIKHYYPKIAEYNIACHVVEYDTRLFKILEKTHQLHGPELGRLNEEIIKLTNPELRKKAIAVREKIISLYENGENPEVLTQHTLLTTQLLMSKSGRVYSNIERLYRINAQKLTNNPNALWQALGAAMFILGAAILAVGASFSYMGIGLLVGGIGLFAIAGRSKGLIDKTSVLIDETHKSSMDLN